MAFFISRGFRRFRILGVSCLLVLAGSAKVSGVAAQDSPSPADATGSSAVGEATIADGDCRKFGATGDGISDDTEAIQRAVDSGIGRIEFPKGTYRITRPIRIDLHEVGRISLSGAGVASIEMVGAGPALRIIGKHFASADPQNFSEDIWARQRMPLVDGLAIVGKHPEAVGIEASGTMQLTLSRLHLRGLLHGIHLLENNRNVIVSECHVYHNRGIGVFYDRVNLHQSNIVNCHISYNSRGGIVALGGNVRNIQIAGCDLESNMSPETEATANVLIDCRGSQAGTAEVAITGCTIQHNNPSPDSANIRIIGNSDPSPRLPKVREGNVTIAGNVLSDVQVNLHLRECRGVAISGNTFWQGYRHNLLVESCSSIVMAGNNLDRNPRYDYGNTADANNGVVFRDCEDCTISGLHVTNVWRSPAGVLIENGRRINLTDSTILDCDSVGLLLKNVSLSRVSDCLIRDDRETAEGRPKSVAIRVEGGSGLMLTDNQLDGPIEGAGESVSQNGNLVQ
jgi:hypothetical protein